MKKVFMFLSLVGLACTGMTQNIPSYVPSNGLVGWWPFNGNANDESGNGNNGTVNGAMLTNDRFGNLNSAYNFSSNSQNISILGLYQTGISEYSISGWFNKNSGSPNQHGSLVSASSCDATPIRTGLRVFAGIINRFYFAAESQSCVNGVGTVGEFFEPSDGNWHHFVAIFNAPPGSIQPSAFKIYIDGQLIIQSPIAQQPSNLPISPINNQGLSLMFGNTICNCDYFPGSLDDIGIWNRALDSTEITQLYQTQSSNSSQGNVGINVVAPQRSLHIKDAIRLEPRNTPLENPVSGDMYYDAVLKKLRVYDGTTWQNCW